jgi:shikimate kinase
MMKDGGRSIVLVGFMGTGKSSVGRRLARAQRWPRYDTDQMIALALRMPITAIFSELGEERFREEETAVLERLDPKGPCVIVAGGGAVLRPKNIMRMRELGTVVCLTASAIVLNERLGRRTDRPLLQGQNLAEKIESLLRVRESLYAEAADLTIDTSSLTHDEVAESIRKSLHLVR